MQRITLVIASITTLGLAACGDNPGERAVIGGAAGAGVSAVADGNILAGAAIGAGANVLYCEANPGKC